MSFANKSIFKYLIVCVVFLTIIINRSATILFLPSLPSMAEKLNISRAQAQLFVPSIFLGVIISQLTLGYIASFIKEKTLLIVISLICIFGGLLSLVEWNYFSLLISMFVQGVGVGILFSVAQLLTKKQFKANAVSAFSYITMICSFAPPVMMSISAHLYDRFGWGGIYSFFILLNLVVLILSLFFPGKKKSQPRNSASLKQYLCTMKEISGNKKFRMYVMSLGLFSASLSSFYTISPFLIVKDLQYSQQVYSLLMFLPFSGLFIGRMLSGILSKKLNSEQLISSSIIWGFFVSLLMMITCYFFLNAYLLMIFFMLYLIGHGLCSPNARIGALAVVEADMAFTASLLSVFINMLFVISSFTSAYLDDHLLTTIIFFISALNLINYGYYKYRKDD